MKTNLNRSLCIVICVAASLLAGGCATLRSAPLLDGREKSFVVVGYSTSYAWPDMLQDMLDEHAGGKRVYHVLNAVVGGSPVERWINDEFTDHTFGAMQRDYFGPEARLRGDAPEPTIALCQQSLQMTQRRLGPVTSSNDSEGIRIGADAMEALGAMLHNVGLQRVYWGMHIFKKGYEPEVGNERFALAELLHRGHSYNYRGPDVWSRTIAEHPDAFTEDGLHPNERGMKIMAEAWYGTLAGDAANEQVIEHLHARAYDVNPMMHAYIDKRRAAAESGR